MNPFFAMMLIWVFCFVVTMTLYYYMSIGFPQYWWLNSLIVALFGFTLAYLLGYYILGTGLIMVPLII